MIIELLIIFFSVLIFLRIINITFPVIEGSFHKKIKKAAKKVGKGIKKTAEKAGKGIQSATQNVGDAFSGDDDYELDPAGYRVITDKIDNQGRKINELNKEIDTRIKEAEKKEGENLVLLKSMEEDVDFLMKHKTAENFFEEGGGKAIDKKRKAANKKKKKRR